MSLDLSKGCDRVNWNTPWQTLGQHGVFDRLMKTLLRQTQPASTLTTQAGLELEILDQTKSQWRTRAIDSNTSTTVCIASISRQQMYTM